jgi:Flp pilus assembly protein TadD
VLVKVAARDRLLIVFALVVATSGVYAEVRNFGFLSLDDGKYVAGNEHVLGGLSLDGLRWAITTGFTNNWHPLTWLSLMLDVELFGADPGAIHLVNLVLHLTNTVLVFLIFDHLTGSTGCSAFLAGVFGLHPLHVESVAWISERKDVLSAFFWLSATAAYARYARSGSRATYLAAGVLFALGLCAKPMVVTWPFAMLLFDVWPLRRVEPSRLLRQEQTGRLLLEKLPFIALSIASAWITASLGAYYGDFTLGQRLGNAAVSYARYLGKTVWPSDLAILYPHPGDWPVWQVGASAVLLLAITALVLRARERPFLLVGWLLFVGSLVPTIGLAQVGYQAMADRYMYLPMLGLGIAVAWGAAARLGDRRPTRLALAVTGCLALAAFGIASKRYVRAWSDSDAIFTHALASTRDNWIVHFFHGENQLNAGKFAEAIVHLEETVRLRPSLPRPHHMLAIAHDRLGNARAALAAYARAAEAQPSSWVGWLDLAKAAQLLGEDVTARAAYRRVVALEPDHVEASRRLGWMLALAPTPQPGDGNEAAELFRRALAASPDETTQDLDGLGAALAQAGSFDEAAKSARRAAELARRDGQTELAAQIERRAQGYERHEPARLEPDR